MKPTHYHITNTFSAVTLYKDPKKGIVWTSDGYKADSIHLHPIEELIGLEVTRAGWVGRIMGFLSDERRLLDGRYLLSGRYGMKKNLEFLNAQVGVFWDNNTNIRLPSPPYWNDYHNLKFTT
jgi:hypothetical protein